MNDQIREMIQTINGYICRVQDVLFLLQSIEDRESGFCDLADASLQNAINSLCAAADHLHHAEKEKP